MTRLALWVGAFGIASASFSNEARAQDLRGTVRDSTTRQPIPGAVVSVIDAGGRSLGRGISNDRGQFRVVASPNAREINVKRIGFRPRVVAVPSDVAASMDIVMTPLASLLEPIQVSDATKCSRRSDRAAALALWDQVRTGLLATVVARETNPASVRRLVFDRVLDRSGKPQAQSVRIDSARTDRAFGAALTIAEFLERGFKSDSGGQNVFYGPDADVLLSDGFAAGYCFRIADRDVARPGQVGLAFSPAERRQERTDIEGTLWVDSVARRLVDIDYGYLGLEARVAALHPGGRTSFRTMPNGMVVLDRWVIRLVAGGPDSPTAFRSRAVERCPRGTVCLPTPVPQPTLQVHEIGGEIAHAQWPDGTEWIAPLGTLRGRAMRDSVPAAGVTVRLDGTDYAATTEATGAFEIDELLPGPYDLRIENEQLASVGLLMPTGVTFNAARDSTEIVSAEIPSLDDYTWRTCKSDPKRPRAARPAVRLLIVRLLESDGRPAAWAKATVKQRRSGETIASSDVETGSGGIFQMCELAALATDVVLFVDRDGSPPFTYTARLTGLLTTASVTLPAMRTRDAPPR
jgi:Carboxypeptidase regulatory-like domain